jgi:hypothetical protein
MHAILSAMFPTLPEVPPSQRAIAHGPLRYEDVTQDGRLLLTALPHFMGLAVFQKLLVKDELARHNAHAGIVPIVSRLVVQAGPGPVSVTRTVTTEGAFATAHTVDDAGAVNRIVLNMWATMSAPPGRTHGPQPAHAGAPVELGRVFGEHVLTRLLAPPERRRVTRLEPGPWPEVPPLRQEWRLPESLLILPPHAEPLDATLAPDAAPCVFGLMHTDSNQHVNSLVYPRLFEDATLRRLAARGRSTNVLGRTVEIAYRKPCFAGQRMRILLQAYVREGLSGAVGTFVPDDDLTARPHAVVRLELG